MLTEAYAPIKNTPPDGGQGVLQPVRTPPLVGAVASWRELGLDEIQSSGLDAVSAGDMLDAAAKHMRDRASTYDKPAGERSMEATVKAFNAITGRDLRESEGWLLLAVLKMVRGEQRRDPHRDSAEDLIAYGALYGEARMGGR